jgi:hypothetical protein
VGEPAACIHCATRFDERFLLSVDHLLPQETSSEAQKATANLLASFPVQRSRRSLLKGASVAAGGLAVGAAGMFYGTRLTHASTIPASNAVQGRGPLNPGKVQDTIVSILTVARTAEQLAVTFYSHGIDNASQLGITGDNLTYLKAALVEEQIHQQFFAANGGQSLTDTFSFPQGAKTFTDLTTFIATQQQLEGVFDSAFLAAVVEFAQIGRPDLAQVSAQVACIEAEHRALGRSIGNLSPADNWAFTPVLLGSVGDAPALVKKAGYLTPVSGNSYTYQQVSTDDAGVEQRKPYAVKTTAGNG